MHNSLICISKKVGFFAVVCLGAILLILLSTLSLRSNQAKRSRASLSKMLPIPTDIEPTLIPLQTPGCYFDTRKLCLEASINRNMKTISFSTKADENSKVTLKSIRDYASKNGKFGIAVFYKNESNYMTVVLKTLPSTMLFSDSSFTFNLGSLNNTPYLSQITNSYATSYVLYTVVKETADNGSITGTNKLSTPCVSSPSLRDLNCVSYSPLND